jgi:hypothetical protein
MNEYNYLEAAEDLAARHEIAQPVILALLKDFFGNVLPDRLLVGPVTFRGFGGFKVIRESFSNPATEDPKDRIVKNKVHFHSFDGLDLKVRDVVFPGLEEGAAPA